MQNKLSIIWEGAFFSDHSLAKVNRNIVLELIKNDILISLKPYQTLKFLDLPDKNKYPELYKLLNFEIDNPLAHIRHQWPPNFNSPPKGAWVFMQAWEYGSIPKKWLEYIQTEIDQVWVYSNYIKECFIKSGVNKENIRTLTLGVDTNIFNPQVKPLSLNTNKTFKFLFVGGTIDRKGIDILLNSYLRNFTKSDDVCLVIKDFGERQLYQEMDFKDYINSLKNQTNLPEILYIEDKLTERQIASLYKSCNCYIHPYRGEGFGLTIAEAMACGLPVIVPNYGSCLDFCDKETAYLVSAKEVRKEILSLKDTETVNKPWWCEVNEEELFKIMKYVFQNPEKAFELGMKASFKIHNNFTWKHSAKKVINYLQELKEKRIKRFSLKKILWQGINELIPPRIYLPEFEIKYQNLYFSSQSNSSFNLPNFNTRFIATTLDNLVYDNKFKTNIAWLIDAFENISKSQIEICNKFDQIWLIDEKQKDIFLSNNISTQINIVPPGINIHDFKTDLDEFLIPDKKGFNILTTCINIEDLKNIIIVYLKTFDNKSDISLIIKPFYDNSIYEKILEIIESYGFEPTNIPDIIILNQEISEKEWASLFPCVDCFFIPLLKDKYIIKAMQAMCCKTVVILPYSDFLPCFFNSQNSLIFRNKDELTLIIQKLYTKQINIQKYKINYISEKYNWEKITKLMIPLLNNCIYQEKNKFN